MDPYLTDQDYEIAKQNGISKINAYNRFYTLGWTKKRAITIPMRAKKSRSQWSDWEQKSVVSYPVFLKRIRSGWDPETAALTPGLRVRRRDN